MIYSRRLISRTKPPPPVRSTFRVNAVRIILLILKSLLCLVNPLQLVLDFYLLSLGVKCRIEYGRLCKLIQVFPEWILHHPNNLYFCKRSIWTCYLLCKKLACHHSAKKPLVTDRIFQWIQQIQRIWEITGAWIGFSFKSYLCLIGTVLGWYTHFTKMFCKFCRFFTIHLGKSRLILKSIFETADGKLIFNKSIVVILGFLSFVSWSKMPLRTW